MVFLEFAVKRLTMPCKYGWMSGFSLLRYFADLVNEALFFVRCALSEAKLEVFIH